MYQPFLMEKANFLAEHHHLPEQERLRRWTRYNRGLDELALVGQDRLPDIWLDAGTNPGRRLSVPGNRNSYRNFRLTQSAPPSCWVPRTNTFDVGSPDAWCVPTGPRPQDDSSIPVYEIYEATDAGYPNSSVEMAPSANPFQDDLHSPLDTAMNGLEGAGYLGPALPDCPNSPPLQSPVFYYTVDPPGHHEGLVDMQWSENSTNTSVSSGLTLGSTLTSDMSRQDSACSDASNSGGIVPQSFGCTFPSYPPLPNAEFIADDSASFITSSLHCTPSIYVDVSAANTMDGSPFFDSTHFDFPAEDNPHGLSPPAFATSPTIACPRIKTDHFVKCDSPPFKNDDTPPVNTETNTTAHRRDHNYGLRPLASKAAYTSVSGLATSETYSENVYESREGKRKLAISKSTYSRPKHPKKHCDLCTEYPEGFRGEHELRRHMDRAHKVVRKMYICVDKSQDGKFLDHCKKCKNKKKYGAYYNAAAHLRRTHFNKRQRGCGRGRTTEKRAGAGGGDFPSMEFLKAWILEVEDLNPEASNVDTLDSSSDDEIFSANVPSTDEFEPYHFFDNDEMLCDYSSYLIKQTRDSASSFAARSEGDSYSLNLNVQHLQTSQTNRLKPNLRTKNNIASNFVPRKISSCQNSLDPSFFPRLHRRPSHS